MATSGIIDLVYYAMVATFVTHELDAVRRHEWRVLPLTSFLPDTVGERVFIWLHIPLLALLLWGGDGTATGGVRIGLSAFAIVHVGLHWIYRGHPANEFNTPGSWALIVSPGLLGAMYLALVLPA